MEYVGYLRRNPDQEGYDGKDTFPYHRPQGPLWPATKVSENYLTGVKLTTTDHWVRDDNKAGNEARPCIKGATVSGRH
jgi:hypothetical protein